MSASLNLSQTVVLGLVVSPWALMLLALALDHSLGEPRARWHPVVWMGHYLERGGKRYAPSSAPANKMERRLTFWRAARYWCLGALVIALAASAMQWVLRDSHGLLRFAFTPAQDTDWYSPAFLGFMLLIACVALILAYLLKLCLSWRMLKHEVLAVEHALSDNVEAGRARLRYLVSRDVSDFNPTQVRESALESLAENLNDSVFAPLFWFVVGGLPAAVVYRYANTADAMWGYRGMRDGRYWSDAGHWAARADDVLSWLPARLCALSLLLVAYKGDIRQVVRLWPTLKREAARTPSPNSGWPMAALALALDLRLAKPGAYVLHATGQAPQTQDMRRAIALCQAALWWPLGVGSVCMAVGLWGFGLPFSLQ